MDLQYIGQTVFKSLNKKKQAIFFSLLRKVFIVVPLTYLMPYVLHMGTDGVFLAEPVSNVIGGSLCFITMLILVLPELKRMEQQSNSFEKLLKKVQEDIYRNRFGRYLPVFVAIHTIKRVRFPFFAALHSKRAAGGSFCR